MVSAVGQVIGSRFEIEEEVGRGGLSIIYRAKDRETGDDVAVKILQDGAANDPALTVRLTREHRAMVALEGTHAVRAITLGSTVDGAMCLVMELLEGIDFDRLLERVESVGERLGVGRTLRILDAIADTLAVAHSKGIVHRDLEPGNIQVLDDGGVRLLDFGLAKVGAPPPLTKEGLVTGSPSYIAPEVWKRRPDLLDERVDVYSLGAIVFRALAGRVPFEADSIPNELELAATAERPSLHALRPEVPPAIDDWVAQALAIVPDQRFSRIEAMWGALRDSLGLEPRPRAPASSSS